MILRVLRRRLKDLARDIERKLNDHEVGKLLTTIDGVRPLTVACLIAELGDPARFRSAAAIATLRIAPTRALCAIIHGECSESRTGWRSEVNSNCRYRFVNSQTTASG
jgi:hypothetical protein